jgi:hypothetical protein
MRKSFLIMNDTINKTIQDVINAINIYKLIKLNIIERSNYVRETEYKIGLWGTYPRGKVITFMKQEIANHNLGWLINYKKFSTDEIAFIPIAIILKMKIEKGIDNPISNYYLGILPNRHYAFFHEDYNCYNKIIPISNEFVMVGYNKCYKKREIIY